MCSAFSTRQRDAKGQLPLSLAKERGAPPEAQALLSRAIDRRMLALYAGFEHDSLGAVIADDFLARGGGALRYAVALAAAAQLEARRLRAADQVLADKLSMLSTRLQLAAGALLSALHALEPPERPPSNGRESSKRRVQADSLLDAMLGAQSGALIKEAQRDACKVLLSQPLVYAYLVRRWRGAAIQGEVDDLSWWDTVWTLFRVLALPLIFPAVALWPPLAESRQLRGWTSREAGIASPFIKFVFFLVSDVALATLVTLLATEAWVPRSPLLAPTLVVLAGVSWTEGCQLARGGLKTYSCDPFNAIDATALLATWAGLLIRLAEPESAEDRSRHEYGHRSLRSLLAAAVAVLWLRMLKLCVLHSKLGPLVLMVFKMVGDVCHWLAILALILLGPAARPRPRPPPRLGPLPRQRPVPPQPNGPEACPHLQTARLRRGDVGALRRQRRAARHVCWRAARRDDAHLPRNPLPALPRHAHRRPHHRAAVRAGLVPPADGHRDPRHLSARGWPTSRQQCGARRSNSALISPDLP